MNILFLKFTLLFLTIASIDNPCLKCDIDKVKAVQASIDSLTFKIVKDFLCTFDSTCINDAEYSESSNGTLFTILEYNPTLFFQVISEEKLDNELFLKVIKNPIHDLIDLQKVYNKIKLAKMSQNLKYNYLEAVEEVASKIKLKIQK
jgi:hypothetical protein